MSAVLGGSSHVMSIKTKLGADKLLVLRVDGRERLSRLPEYVVDLVGNASMLTGRESIDLHALLGTVATVSFDVHGNTRYIDGHVVKAQRGERHGRYDSYQIILKPWLWFATRSKNSRVFQMMAVDAIIKKVLDDYSTDYKWKATGTLPTLEYCVQYDESDFDFVSRLMEEYGVYYFFEHSVTMPGMPAKHTLVMVDEMTQHDSRTSTESVAWSNKFDGDHCMTEWRTMEEVRAAKAVVRDYDYLASDVKIEGTKAGAASADCDVLGTAEIYEFPAKAVLNQVKKASQSAAADAKAAAKRLIEAAQSMHKLHTGTTNAHDMTCGATFTLSKAPQFGENGDYVIVASEFRAEYGDHEAIEDLKSIKGRRDGFVGKVVVLHAKHGLFRPERSTPRPRMYGPQVAQVVGASGNEIETDEVGRVKILFPWDRDGQDEAAKEKSSCWVRVAQPWAGKKMGLWMLPRVGHEVVVSFIGGDPDRPIVTGSVHNDLNPPPYAKDHPDVATWISRTTPKKADDAQNELRFCDTKDKEHVWFQAQKDFYRHVKGDVFDHVELNETRKVLKTLHEVVGENWYLRVDGDVKNELGKDLHTLVQGDVVTTSEKAGYHLKLKTDYRAEVGADYGLEVKGKTNIKSTGDANVQTDGAINLKATGNLVGEATGKVSLKSAADVLMEGLNIKAKGATEIVLEASTSIKIVCGSSVITLGPAGVTIDGPLVKVNCGGGGGSAGAAESAADAKLGDLALAVAAEVTSAGKDEDYMKKLADPLAPKEAATAPPGAVAAPVMPDVPELPDPTAAADALAAKAAAATAAAATAAAGAAMAASMAAMAAAAAATAGGMVAAAVVTVVDKQLDDPNSGLSKLVHAVDEALDPLEELIDKVDDKVTEWKDAAEQGIETGLDIANKEVGKGLEKVNERVTDAMAVAGDEIDKAIDVADDALGVAVEATEKGIDQAVDATADAVVAADAAVKKAADDTVDAAKDIQRDLGGA